MQQKFILKAPPNRMCPVKFRYLDRRRQSSEWHGAWGRAWTSSELVPSFPWLSRSASAVFHRFPGLNEEDVRERGVRVPALQAHRAAVRLLGAVLGRGGSAESRLGDRRPLLPVAVGVLLPVRGTAARRGGWVELLLHPHLWYGSLLTASCRRCCWWRWWCAFLFLAFSLTFCHGLVFC